MKTFKLFMIIGIGSSLTFVSCSEQKKFEGSARVASDEVVTSDPPKLPEGTTMPDTPPAGPSDCVDGDVVKFSFPTNIQTCMDNSKIYNFDTKACTDVSSITNFTCSFDGLNGAASKLLERDSIVSVTSAQTGGALLVSCGEKNSGKTIVAQWYYPAVTEKKGECDYVASGASIVTACYKLYESGTKPPTPVTDAEKAERVRQCLAE